MVDVRNLLLHNRETLISSDERILRTFGLSTSLVSQIDEIIECIDAMYAAFNEDELAYLEYRRHVECHPLQDGYKMKVSDGKIIDRTRKLTRRLWTHEEEDAALRRVFRRYGRIFAAGPDETPIAREFAARLTPILDRLGPALVPIFGSDQFSWEEQNTRPKHSL